VEYFCLHHDKTTYPENYACGYFGIMIEKAAENYLKLKAKGWQGGVI